MFSESHMETPLVSDSTPSRTVLNVDPNVDLKKQPMFFGAELGLDRYDKIRYPIFERLTDEQQKNYWRPHDINLSQDAIDYENLEPHVRHIFDKNLSYQTVMDSVATRVTVEAFLPLASLPEVKDCIRTWSYFESIHNRAYQWIQQNLHSDPSVAFDAILRDSKITERALSIVQAFDELTAYSDKVRVVGYENPYQVVKFFLTVKEHKRLLYRAMIAQYALESIRFYVSFACTFALAQQGKMTGNGKEMKLIARDEALHVGIVLNILRLWGKEDQDFKAIALEETDFVYLVFKEVVAQETAWAEYLFKDGVILGLNVTGMVKYLEHRGNKALKALGLTQVFENKANPFSWMSAWVSGDKHQVAPQETEIDAYKVSALSTTVSDKSRIVDF